MRLLQISLCCTALLFSANAYAATTAKTQTASYGAQTPFPKLQSGQIALLDIQSDFRSKSERQTSDMLRQALSRLPQDADFLTKRDNAAIRAFYEQRDFRPAWFVPGSDLESIRAMAKTIGKAHEDGLDPQNYPMPALLASGMDGASEQERLEADIQLSETLTRYVRHAFAGQIDPRNFSKKEITIKPHYPDSIKALNDLTSSDDPQALLAGYHPVHKGYLALRAEYNRLRLVEHDDKLPMIPAGKSLKLGMKDKRIALIRERLGVEGAKEQDNRYDKGLIKTVKDFQKQNGLVADGVVGPATLRILNGDHKGLLADMVANMERWRWLPRDLGDFHVFVNIPTFHVQVVKKGKKVHQTRVVVGKTKHKTPVFSDQMEYVVVNPYWNVPKSIASKELLPKIQANPAAFFAKRNYQVLASVKGRSEVIDPSKLDWSKVSASDVRLRQTPGRRNALGNVKFMFPNQHAVYLHDTPSKSLFKRDYRAYSHGCVRVHNPMEFADVILSQTQSWNAARLKKMIGGKESHINLDRKIPVHLAYFTTWIDEKGQLQLRSDLYGHNEKVKQMLRLSSN